VVIKGFGTRRIGKLMPDGYVFFTVGGTKYGEDIGLNETIRTIIEIESLDVVEGRSSAGQKQHGPIGAYLGFKLAAATDAQLTRIVHRVEGAILMRSDPRK